MKAISKLALLLFTATLFNCSPNGEKALKITGTVINSDTKSILLVKPHQDPRHDSIIELQVENGTFSYEAKLEHPEAVYLFLGEMLKRGGGRHMPLFLENEKIDLTIYPEEEFDNNIIEGGKLNAEYKKFIDKKDVLFKSSLQPLTDSVQILF